MIRSLLTTVSRCRSCASFPSRLFPISPYRSLHSTPSFLASRRFLLTPLHSFAPSAPYSHLPQLLYTSRRFFANHIDEDSLPDPESSEDDIADLWDDPSLPPFARFRHFLFRPFSQFFRWLFSKWPLNVIIRTFHTVGGLKNPIKSTRSVLKIVSWFVLLILGLGFLVREWVRRMRVRRVLRRGIPRSSVTLPPEQESLLSVEKRNALTRVISRARKVPSLIFLCSSKGGISEGRNSASEGLVCSMDERNEKRLRQCIWIQCEGKSKEEIVRNMIGNEFSIYPSFEKIMGLTKLKLSSSSYSASTSTSEGSLRELLLCFRSAITRSSLRRTILKYFQSYRTVPIFIFSSIDQIRDEDEELFHELKKFIVEVTESGEASCVVTGSRAFRTFVLDRDETEVWRNMIEIDMDEKEVSSTTPEGLVSLVEVGMGHVKRRNDSDSELLDRRDVEENLRKIDRWNVRDVVSLVDRMIARKLSFIPTHVSDSVSVLADWSEKVRRELFENLSSMGIERLMTLLTMFQNSESESHSVALEDVRSRVGMDAVIQICLERGNHFRLIEKESNDGSESVLLLLPSSSIEFQALMRLLQDLQK